MKKLQIYFWSFAALLLSASFLRCSAPQSAEKIKITWRLSDPNSESPGKDMEFVLYNKGTTSFPLEEWDLWFNAIYPVEDTIQTPYQLINKKGNLYKIEFDEGVKLEKNDSLIVRMESAYAINNIAATPNGLYFQHREDYTPAFDIEDYEIINFVRSKEQNRKHLASLFEKNKRAKEDVAQRILPTPKNITVHGEEWKVPSQLVYFVDEELQELLDPIEPFVNQIFQKQSFQAEEEAKQADVVIRFDKNLKEEAYQLHIHKGGADIRTSGYSGLFYALQSLKNMMTPGMLSGSEDLVFPTLDIEDAPRYGYRGQSIDIGRNFHSKELILKYIDILSSYKMNILHLHLTDDEGWRLEIPSLPELTEIGSVRNAYYKEGKSIQPAYGSGTETEGKQYLTASDFKEILRYAAARAITVLPEIETPGHARAAIKAMQARYTYYNNQGNKEEAEKYLLYHPEDESVYSSVQYFDDNVMDVALPSTYTFISTVVDDIKKMYEEAGLKLKRIHIGGDEVPDGVWEKSPAIQQLMKEKGFSSVYEVWPYYIHKVRGLLKEKGMEIAGWEEVGMVNKGEGMVPNADVNKENILVDVWNNVIGQGQEDLAYKLANAGYKTIIVGASHYYLDMAWNKDWKEPGFQWASHTDLYHSYSLLPENYFANVHLAERAKDLSKEYFAEKEKLSEAGRKNIVGIKGGLWSETILTDERVDYMLLPRLLSIAERGWSAKRDWENEENFNLASFDQEYLAFANKVGRIELPKLEVIFDKLNYRVPDVGLKEINGQLHANTELPGFAIYYTEDGSEPTQESALYTEPIDLQESANYHFRCFSPSGKKGKVARY